MVIRVLEKEEIHGALCLAAGIFNGLEQEDEILRQAEEENLILAGCFGDGPAAGSWMGHGRQRRPDPVRICAGGASQARDGNSHRGHAPSGVQPKVRGAADHCTGASGDGAVSHKVRPAGVRATAPGEREDLFPHGGYALPVELKPHKNGFRMGLIIGGVCVAVLVLCLLIFLLGKKVVGEVESLQEVQRQEERQKEIPDEPETEVLPGYEEEEPAEKAPAEDEGIDDIPAYAASDVSYQLTEENYKEKEPGKRPPLIMILIIPGVRLLRERSRSKPDPERRRHGQRQYLLPESHPGDPGFPGRAGGALSGKPGEVPGYLYG